MFLVVQGRVRNEVVRVLKTAVNSRSSAYGASAEFWFTPKRWITGVRRQAASIIEALGFSCFAVFDTSFLETLLLAITARKFGGDPPRMSIGRLALVWAEVAVAGLW
jgi:hypothetical protein